MWLNSKSLEANFAYISLLYAVRRTAVIELKLLVMTVPALILMSAHIIVHAIKEVQMLSGTAHIVIS